MKSSRRRAVSRLPTSLAGWEVDLARGPFVAEHLNVDGLLVIAEAGSGQVRSAGPVVVGKSLWELLRVAFFEPTSPAEPARPRVMRCRDPELARRLERETAGLDLRIEVVDELPAVGEVVESLLAHLGAVGAAGDPGVSEDVPAWRAALRSFAARRPWREVPDRVIFRFRGGPTELNDAVGMLIGLAGEQEGFVLFPTDADHARFLEGVAAGRSGLEGVTAWCVYLDEPETLRPHERARCEDLDLVLPGPRMPLVHALRSGQMRPATPAEQRALRAALEAVAGMSDRDLLAACHAPVSRDVRTTAGPIAVRTSPGWGPDEDERPDLPLKPLVRYVHAIGLGTLHATDGTGSRPTLALKLAKRDAVRLAAELAHIDAVHAWSEPGHRVVFHASEDGRPIGVLAAIDDRQRRHSRQLEGADRLFVIVAAGGTQRPRVRPEDVVAHWEVALHRGPATSGGAPRERG